MSGDVTECAECGNAVYRTTRVCPYCGATLRRVVAPSQVPEKEEQSAGKKGGPKLTTKKGGCSWLTLAALVALGLLAGSVVWAAHLLR